MRKIGQLLESKRIIRGKEKEPNKWDEKGIFYAFQRIIRDEYGNQGLAHFRPDFWKDGRLFIWSDSAVWASELQLRREELRQKVNNELGQEEVREIRIKK